MLEKHDDRTLFLQTYFSLSVEQRRRVLQSQNLTDLQWMKDSLTNRIKSMTEPHGLAMAAFTNELAIVTEQLSRRLNNISYLRKIELATALPLEVKKFFDIYFNLNETDKSIVFGGNSKFNGVQSDNAINFMIGLNARIYTESFTQKMPPTEKKAYLDLFQSEMSSLSKKLPSLAPELINVSYLNLTARQKQAFQIMYRHLNPSDQIIVLKNQRLEDIEAILLAKPESFFQNDLLLRRQYAELKKLVMDSQTIVNDLSKQPFESLSVTAAQKFIGQFNQINLQNQIIILNQQSIQGLAKIHTELKTTLVASNPTLKLVADKWNEREIINAQQNAETITKELAKELVSSVISSQQHDLLLDYAKKYMNNHKMEAGINESSGIKEIKFDRTGYHLELNLTHMRLGDIRNQASTTNKILSEKIYEFAALEIQDILSAKKNLFSSTNFVDKHTYVNALLLLTTPRREQFLSQNIDILDDLQQFIKTSIETKKRKNPKTTSDLLDLNTLAENVANVIATHNTSSKSLSTAPTIAPGTTRRIR
jgi:hypothetical protein